MSREEGEGRGGGVGGIGEGRLGEERLPWFVWTSLASVTCILVGSYWDISWHMSIGRDSFWTPAHLLIQAGGIIAGLSGAYLIFGRKLPEASIGVLGFRGPFGAFLGTWGAATMVVSAPFDNWWHNAYGLDVKILSPPHAVLTLGILGVAVAGVLLVLATMNRATGAERARLQLVLLVIAGEILVLSMTAILEKTFRANLHRADAYRAIAIVAPLILVTMSRVSDHGWAATLLAGFYTLFMASMVWLFPLFPAEPKLGPVYQHITHYVPLQFPVLVIAPAIAIDLLRRWRAPRWVLAPVLGTAFLVVMVAAEWPFATFVNEDTAPALFGSEYHPYFARPDWFETRHLFLPPDEYVIGFAEALVAAIATSALGLVIGDAMRKVQR